MLLHAEGQRDHCLSLMLDKGRLVLYHQHGGWIYSQYVNMCEKAKNKHTVYTLDSHIKCTFSPYRLALEKVN